MDEEIVLRWVEQFPELETFIGAGSISLKLARDILGIDRYYMYDIYKDLIRAGAVFAVGGSTWRATEECQRWLAERRAAKK